MAEKIGSVVIVLGVVWTEYADGFRNMPKRGQPWVTSGIAITLGGFVLWAIGHFMKDRQGIRDQ